MRPRTLAVPSAVAVAAISAALLARLVYLSVWNREVSATEDPGLREPAVDSGSRGKRSGATIDFSKPLGDEIRSGISQVLAVAVLGAVSVIAMRYWRRCAGRSRATTR